MVPAPSVVVVVASVPSQLSYIFFIAALRLRLSSPRPRGIRGMKAFGLLSSRGEQKRSAPASEGF